MGICSKPGKDGGDSQVGRAAPKAADAGGSLFRQGATFAFAGWHPRRGMSDTSARERLREVPTDTRDAWRCELLECPRPGDWLIWQNAR